MNQTVSAAETVFSAAHPDIKKSTSISSLILSVLLLAAGAALLFFSSKVDDSSSSSGPMLLVGGVALLATGGIRLLVGKKNLIYTPTGSIVKKGSCFFDTGSLSLFREMLEEKAFDGQKEIRVKNDGGLRIDYMTSQDGRFVAVQLFQYVPYAYEPVSDIFYYTGDDAGAFVNCLKAGRF